MKTTVTSKSFDEYWEETVWNRDGYPQEVVALLKRHEQNAWNSAVMSAGNNTYLALQEEFCYLVPNTGPIGPGALINKTIWSMRQRLED